MTRRVWGFVHRADSTEAAYFVQWTPGSVDKHGAHFDLIIGHWGEGSTPSERTAVSLAFQRSATGPGFTVIDAPGRDFAESQLVGKALRRAEVLNAPIGAQAFAIVDAIWLNDARIAELVTDAA
jgi:hypothetical protein